MFVSPLDTPISLPAESSTARPAADAPAAGPSFGEHLKQARPPEQPAAAQHDRHDRREARPTGEHTSGSKPTGEPQPEGQATTTAADSDEPDTNLNDLLHTCLTAGCETESAADEGAAEKEASADSTLLAREMIAQAVPVVVTQVNTQDPSPQPAIAAASETDAPSKPSGAQPTALPTEAHAEKNTKKTQGVLSQQLPGDVPHGKTARIEGPNQPAAAAVPVAEDADATGMGIPTSTSENTVLVARVEPPAVKRAKPAKAASSQAPTGKPDSSGTADAATSFTAVTLVAAGTLPQPLSATTVSAAVPTSEKIAPVPVGEPGKAQEPGSLAAASPEGPLAERQPHLAPREPTEPAKEIGDAHRTDGNETSRTNLSEADRVRFVQRVSRAIHTAVDRGGEVRLRLSPPDLGRLTLDVVVRDGVMSARLEAESHATRSLLIDNLPALRDRLAEQNVRIDRFDVSLRDGTSGSLPDRTPDQSGQHPNRHAPTAGRSREGATSNSRAAPPTVSRYVHTNDQLNVVV